MTIASRNYPFACLCSLHSEDLLQTSPLHVVIYHLHLLLTPRLGFCLFLKHPHQLQIQLVPLLLHHSLHLNLVQCLLSLDILDRGVDVVSRLVDLGVVTSDWTIVLSFSRVHIVVIVDCRL